MGWNRTYSLFEMLRVTTLLVSFLSLAICGCEQDKASKWVTPPAAVQQTLRTLHPEATQVRWERDKDGFYEGSFVLPDSLRRKMRVNPDGRWRETETYIARTALPVPVQDTLQAQLERVRDPKRFRVRHVSMVTYADGRTEYEAQVRLEGGRWRKRYYDAHGKLLREEKMKH